MTLGNVFSTPHNRTETFTGQGICANMAELERVGKRTPAPDHNALWRSDMATPTDRQNPSGGQAPPEPTYTSSKGERRVISAMPHPYLLSALAKLQREEPHRQTEIGDMLAEVSKREEATQ